jgi:3-oxoacyl-[acyl-carrier protein] reductase
VGLAAAHAFVARGLSVAMLGHAGDRLDGAAAEVAAKIAADVAAKGVVARAFACDVASAAQVDRAAAEVIAALGVPSVVVNNAGVVLRGKRIHETSPEEWDEIVAVNLRGPFLVCRAFLPSMLAAERGRFVHVGSISSTIACPGAASYAASKWGLVGLAKSLAEELRGTGLQSIAVLPGSIDTDMLAGSGFAPRMTADDVARVLVHAGLDAPDALTGSAIEMFG